MREQLGGRLAASKGQHTTIILTVYIIFLFSFFFFSCIFAKLCKALVNQRQWILWLSQEALKKISKRPPTGIMTEIDS